MTNVNESITEEGGLDIDRIEIHRTNGHRTTLRGVESLRIEVSRQMIDVTRGPTEYYPGDTTRQFTRGPKVIEVELLAFDIEEQEDAITQAEVNAEIVWDRVGDQGQDAHQLKPLDVTWAIDMRELRRLISQQVQIALEGTDWEVQLKIEVNLKGGPWKELPFGYGHLKVEKRS